MQDDGNNYKTHPELEPSAKVRKLLELLEKIYKDSDGEDKTIVFSQFTGFLDVIEPHLRKEHFSYIRCGFLLLIASLV